MITSLEIKNLRGVRQARLDGFRPLTILLGRNGCGKSTVLEAAGIACAGTNAAAAFSALAAREWLGLAGMSYWWSPEGGATTVATFDPPPIRTPQQPVFVQGYALQSVKTTVELGNMDPGLLQVARDAGEKGDFAAMNVTLVANLVGVPTAAAPGRAPAAPQSLGLPLQQGCVLINDDGHPGWQRTLNEVNQRYAFHGTFADRRAGARMRFQAPRFSSALREALTAIKLTPWYDDFVLYLKELRPKLDTIESIAVGDRDEPFVFERDPRVHYPVAYAGDGFRRALLLASTLAEAKGGVAALDEPEAFEHPSMFPALTRLFRRALADGTQVLVATHSLEFVRAVLEQLTDAEVPQAAVIGLNMNGGVLSPTTIAGPDAHRRVLELGDDLRL